MWAAAQWLPRPSKTYLWISSHKVIHIKGASFISSLPSPSADREHHPDTIGILSHLLFKKETFIPYGGLWGNHINSILKWFTCIDMGRELAGRFHHTHSLAYRRQELRGNTEVCVCVRARACVCMCVCVGLSTFKRQWPSDAWQGEVRNERFRIIYCFKLLIIVFPCSNRNIYRLTIFP